MKNNNFRLLGLTFTFTAAFVAALVMTTAVFAAGGGAHDENHIPVKTILTQAVNLGILLIVLAIFTRKSIQGIFKAKKDLFLEDSLKTAQALKLAEIELSEIKSKIKTLETTESASLLNAEKEAESTAQKMVFEAQAQGKKIVEDTSLVISAELSKAKNLIREKIIEASMLETEKNIKASSASITQKSEKGFLEDLGQVKA